MTVCIALQCQHRGNTCFVLCCDARLEDDTAGGDVALKISPGRENWTYLIAGAVPRAQEYIAVCNNRVDVRAESEAEAVEKFRTGSALTKERLLREYLSTRWAMTPEEFWETGRDRLPDDLYWQTSNEIKQLQLDCEVLIAGFAGRTPVMCLVKANGEVSPCLGFATSGTGGQISQAWLFFRQYKHTFPIEAALYCAYEAKRLSESAPGVGEKTHLAIYGPLRRISGTGEYHAGINFVSENGLSELERHFTELHPVSVKLPEFDPTRYLLSGSSLWQ